MRTSKAADGVRVHLPTKVADPLIALAKRFLWAFLLCIIVAVMVRLDASGYRDAKGDGVSFLDAFYYATVSVTTTGYGDIVPVDNGARVLTSSVVTIARVLFLILLVGTSIEVATQQGRHAISVRRWKKRVKNHVVVCGYGTKGRSAVEALLAAGTAKDHIVVIDPHASTISEAASMGLVGIVGDAARTAVLHEAEAAKARAVIVAANDDAQAALITLTAREMNPRATITAAVREGENAHLLRQGGADSVIVSSTASGRLLGMSTDSPEVVEVVEDLLKAGSGMEIYKRSVTAAEIGARPVCDADEIVIALTRSGHIFHMSDPEAARCEEGDGVIVLVSALSN